MSIYQRRRDAPPDAAFEPGTLEHLVAGNTGRLLDARRTPVSIAEVRAEIGSFVIRIDDFEDRGAQWIVPFEDVSRYQFSIGSEQAAAPDVDRFREAIARFDRPLAIACDPARRAETETRLSEERAAASAWLGRNSEFFAQGGALPAPEARKGDPRLWLDFERFMRSRELWEIEDGIATQYVSNPHSGEQIKAHRIVIAELGLVAFEGKRLRDPSVFEGPRSRDRRAAHVLARLGFVSALFARLGLTSVALYRGIASEGPLRPPSNETFVSASFSIEVARSHFESGGPAATCVLLRQAVPVERIFMTYLETAPMNRHYQEAEAVLLFEPGIVAF